jgi:DNA-cytosine methyltransferase
MKKFTHIDLFSGIGGFSLAARQVWGDDYHNLFFCDNNKYCQAVLRKNFGKEIVIYDEIEKVSKERFLEDYNSNANRHGLQKQGQGEQADGSGQSFKVDLLTAGPPCQPASQAGKREGEDDDRWLWEEMFKVVQDFKPTWCIIENVYGLLTLKNGVVFESLLSKMEALGYEVQPFLIGAVGKNAPHKRYRFWFVAHSIDSSNRTERRPLSKKSGVPSLSRQTMGGGMLTRTIVNDSDPKHKGCFGRGSSSDTNADRIQEGEQVGQVSRGATARCDEERSDVRNPEGTGQPSGLVGQGQAQHGRTSPTGFEGWNRDWFEVATEFCRMDDGVSAKLDGLELSKSQHRVERLKALGNAVVVPLVATLLQTIKDVEENPVEIDSEQLKANYLNISEKKGELFVIKDLRNWQK